MIAEARAPFGDDDVRIAFRRDLGDGVFHVVGRRELALLDVDHASGARAAMRSVCREERGNLQHVGDLGGHSGFRRLVDVGDDGDVESLLIAPSTRKPSRMPGPRNDRFDVRLALSYDALNMSGMPTRVVMSTSASARPVACCSLSTTHGPAMRMIGWPGPITMSRSVATTGQATVSVVTRCTAPTLCL